MISRKGWYQNTSVKFELIKNIQNREMFMLPYKKDAEGKWVSSAPIRWLLANYIGMMEKHWEHFKFLETDMNLYSSVVTWRDFPMFSYNWTQKSQQQKLWNKEFQNHVQKCDCFIETDSSDLKESFADAIKIRDFLNEYKIKYYISMSGSKGCHIIIPYEEFIHLPVKVYDKDISGNMGSTKDLLEMLPLETTELIKNIDLILIFKALNIRIKTILNVPTADITISDILRVRKTPYSIDVKSGLVALPLSDEQLENFDKEFCKPENVLKVVYKRGLLWRNEDVCQTKRRMGINDMLRDLEIIQ